MKFKVYTKLIKAGLLIGMVFFLLPYSLHAQRMKHGAKSGGANRSAVSRQATKPASRSKSGPATKQVHKSGGAINGGNRSTTVKSSGNKVNAGNKVDTGDRKVSAGNKTNVGNKVNIDNSKTNVNINVDNSKNIRVNNNRNTVVRRNHKPYGRPPYRYGGRRYYCYHPYHYHPYRPYYWGPVWHPWGFFVTTMVATAIIVNVENQQYHYDQGVYYIQSDGGYTVVQAPVGATITTLPENSQTVVVNETTNNYYYGGTYYEESNGGYTVVPPMAGTVVENLPEGGEETKIGDVTYVKVGETYYQPIEQDGKNMYEVVQVEEETT